MQDDRSDRSNKSKSKSTKPPSASSTPRQLSSLDADVQQIHLFAAVRAEKLETIKKLVPPASLQTHELSTGETPLHVAVDTGHAKVRAAPAAAALPTRLRPACPRFVPLSSPRPRVVELLLKLGADPGYPDRDGQGVFHRLLSKKEWKREEDKIFKMLIDCKETNADVRIPFIHLYATNLHPDLECAACVSNLIRLTPRSPAHRRSTSSSPRRAPPRSTRPC